jgi:hypothetical protein
MPDDKPLGRRLLGLFVETDPAEKVADEASETSAGERSAADEVAELARASARVAAEMAPRPAVAAAAPPPAERSASPIPKTPTGPPANIDFDGVFRGAGIDAQALDRVRKAEELLKNLPPEAPDQLKRQIVEAALKAFGFDTSKIVDAVVTQTKALDTYVRLNEQQTVKAIADAQAQIAKLDDQIITLKADIEKRTLALGSLSAAADIRKSQIEQVLEFFEGPPAPSAASKRQP